MPFAAASAESALTGSQRAAALMTCLSDEVARGLISELSDDDILTLGLAMGELVELDGNMVQAVIAEFVRDLHEVAVMPISGAEYVSNVLPGLLDPQRKAEILPVINRRVSKEFEDFIAMRPAHTVAAALREEHLQTQVVALCLMGANNAARVMKHLAEEATSEITLRMAKLRKIPGDLADDVTDALHEALEQQDDQLDLGGVDKTARILGQMSRKENGRILDEVSDEDIDLADALRRRMILFEDLATLTNMSVQVVLKQVEREDLVVALKGASAKVVDLFLANVSSRAADDIRDEMDIMGPIPKSRIRQSQERIVASAMRLAEEGSIYLPIGEEDDEDEEA